MTTKEEMNPQTLVILGVIFSVFIISSVYYYIAGIIREKLEQLESNTKEIQELKKTLKTERRFLELEKRILLMEENSNYRIKYPIIWIFISQKFLLNWRYSSPNSWQ